MKANNNSKQIDIGDIPVDWELVTFGNISESISETFKFFDKKVVFLNTSDIYEGKVLHSDKSDPKILPGQAKKRIWKDDILFSEIRPANKRYAYIDFDAPQYVVSTKLMVLRAQQKVLPKYLYTLLTCPKTLTDFQILAESRSGTFPQITFQEISGYQVALPSLTEQQQIVDFLFSINRKIEIDKQMNKTLEEIGKALFKRWFVNFEFPNDDGKPYKSGGGEMVASELGKIPKGWRAGTFGEGLKILDSKRIPLSSREREKRKGIYPYYGATEIVDFVNDYIFDGVYLLVGEDGSVIKGDGSPFTQYVWRKFWANNHTHVLQGTSGFSTEYLLIFLSSTNISPFVTGAVQLKLNQENMKSIPMVVPPSDLMEKFNITIENLYVRIRLNLEQIRALVQIRDSLLPRLMSGKLRVYGNN